MAHAPHHAPAPVAEKFDIRRAGNWPKLSLGIGVIGTVGCLIGYLVGARAQFAHSWLFAFAYFFTITVGCLFWTCLHHATDADWSVVVRRVWENTASTIPYYALLFLPLFLPQCSSALWHWWDKDMDPGRPAITDPKHGYLTHGFFLLRFVVYFVLLGGIAWGLRKQSVSQDRDGLSSRSLLMRKLGVAGIPALALCLTFSAFDWLMGLDYHWFSTMWGVYIFAGAAGASMSLTVILVTVLRRAGYLKPVTIEHYHIMGKLMLAFTIFWAYIGFSQYMLIWYANIPEENVYFRIRNTESWNFFSTLLVVGRFFIPFPILLTQWIKKHPERLCIVAGWVLLMQLLDMYVVVLPSLHQLGFVPSILDLLALAGVGGFVGFLWLRVLPTANLFPTRDPRLAASIDLTN